MSSLDWLAVLWIGAAFAYLSILAHKDDAGCNGCRRRGCRRMPAGHGCNHKPRTEGSESGISKEVL
jgi:hypothetical protein